LPAELRTKFGYNALKGDQLLEKEAQDWKSAEIQKQKTNALLQLDSLGVKVTGKVDHQLGRGILIMLFRVTSKKVERRATLDHSGTMLGPSGIAPNVVDKSYWRKDISALDYGLVEGLKVPVGQKWEGTVWDVGETTYKLTNGGDRTVRRYVPNKYLAARELGFFEAIDKSAKPIPTGEPVNLRKPTLP